MSVKYFPLDIESVKKVGIDKWRDSFFWPVRYSSVIEDEVKQIFNEIIKNESDELCELVTVNYKLYIEYANLIESLQVLKKLASRGLKPLCSGESILFRGLIEKGVPAEDLLLVSTLENRSPVKKFINRLRFAKRQFFVNAGLSAKLKSFSRQPDYYSYYVNDIEFLQGYLSQHPNSGVKLTDPAFWYLPNFSGNLEADQEKCIHTLTADLVTTIEQVAIKHNVELAKHQIEYLYRRTSRLFTETKKCLRALNTYVSKREPIHLLAGSGGNHFVRMLSTVIRKNGGCVTGFAHGSPIIHLWDHYRWIEFLTADKFVIYTKSLATELSSLDKIYPPLSERKVTIEGLESDIYFKLWQREAQKPVPKKIEKVMIVASPFSADNKINYGATVHPLLLLDCTFKVIDCLKQARVGILYKKHPGGLYCGKRIDFFDKDVEIIHDRFENVMDYADAFLFMHSRTSTFGPALCTNKPIIYFHTEWEQWFPQMWELLTKRCRIVDLGLDERNRLSFDKEGLLEAISQKPLEPDLGFARKFMFPQDALV